MWRRNSKCDSPGPLSSRCLLKFSKRSLEVVIYAASAIQTSALSEAGCGFGPSFPKPLMRSEVQLPQDAPHRSFIEFGQPLQNTARLRVSQRWTAVSLPKESRKFEKLRGPRWTRGRGGRGNHRHGTPTRHRLEPHQQETRFHPGVDCGGRIVIRLPALPAAARRKRTRSKGSLLTDRGDG